jgi:hypothetical protein
VVLQKQAAVEAAGVMAPRFEVDPFWPKPLLSALPWSRSIVAGVRQGSV